MKLNLLFVFCISLLGALGANADYSDPSRLSTYIVRFSRDISAIEANQKLLLKRTGVKQNLLTLRLLAAAPCSGKSIVMFQLSQLEIFRMVQKATICPHCSNVSSKLI